MFEEMDDQLRCWFLTAERLVKSLPACAGMTF
jgi:hypothetical protein